MSHLTIFHNGRIYQPPSSTSSSPQFAECMIVDHHGETITYIGALPSPTAQSALSGGAHTHDLHHRLTLPSFIDSHTHLLMTGQSLRKADLSGCRTLADIQCTLRAYALAHPAAPRIMAKGWMHAMTGGKAEAEMLDGVDPAGRPIYVDSKDLHSTWCSSAALSEIGAQAMPDPPGGRIHRDAEGKASGLLSEAAAVRIIWPHLARVATMEEQVGAARAAMEAYLSAGYTGVIDMAMDESSWAALVALRERTARPLPLRVAAHWLVTPRATEAENLAQVRRAVELHRAYNLERTPDLRLVGVKLICDGVVDACTAAVREPYAHDDPGQAGGGEANLLWPLEALTPVVQAADAAGLQVALHAIGDAAIDVALGALDSLPPSSPSSPPPRHRIEHLELATSEQAARLARLGGIASIQPVHSDPAILGAWPRLLGPQRCSTAFPYATLARSGARLALGTDAPTAPWEVGGNLYVATTGRSARDGGVTAPMAGREGEMLGLVEALAATTEGAAWSCGVEGVVGRLEKGFRADFVTVGWEWGAEEGLLGKPGVMGTWVGGQRVWDGEAEGGMGRVEWDWGV